MRSVRADALMSLFVVNLSGEYISHMRSDQIPLRRGTTVRSGIKKVQHLALSSCGISSITNARNPL